MQTDQLDRLSRILKALTNPTALRIVLLLRQQGPLSVRQIHTWLTISQPATSARLIKLADLSVVVREGRHAATRYALTDPAAINLSVLLTLGQIVPPSLPKSRQKRRFRSCGAMTKQDVIQQISQRTGQDPPTSRAVIESFFEVVKQQLAAGESIYVRGFGSFVPKQRAAKVARNISQQTAHMVEAQVVPVFKPSAEFKEQVRAQLPPAKS